MRLAAMTLSASIMASRAARKSALLNWSAGSDSHGFRFRRSDLIASGSDLVRWPSLVRSAS